MSKKRKRNKMNTDVKQETPVTEPVREIIGTNPDGTPIYREQPVVEQTPEHTGEPPVYTPPM